MATRKPLVGRRIDGDQKKFTDCTITITDNSNIGSGQGNFNFWNKDYPQNYVDVNTPPVPESGGTATVPFTWPYADYPWNMASGVINTDGFPTALSEENY